eukprot:1371813-Pleurochrysis_carterae.AAC.2
MAPPPCVSVRVRVCDPLPLSLARSLARSLAHSLSRSRARSLSHALALSFSPSGSAWLCVCRQRVCRARVRHAHTSCYMLEPTHARTRCRARAQAFLFVDAHFARAFAPSSLFVREPLRSRCPPRPTRKS